MSHKALRQGVLCIWVAIVGAALAAAPGRCESRDQVDLYVNLTPRGADATYVALVFGFQPPRSLPLERAIGQAIGGTLRQVRWEAEDGAWTLTGWCDDAFRPRGWFVKSQIDPGPLVRLLRPLGMQWLTLTITHPRAGFIRCPRAQRAPAPDRSSLAYFFPVSVDEGSPPLRLTFGYRRAEWLRAFAPPLLILLLPIGLSLWVRRAALRARGTDPVAAWFGYCRLRRGLSIGTLLAWLTALILLQADTLIRFVLRGQSGVVQFPVEVGSAVLPPLLVAAACGLYLYPVFAHARETEWTPADVARQSAWSLAANIAPLLLVCAMAGAAADGEPRLAILSFAAAFAGRELFLRGWLRSLGLSLNALTLGELRDRVFALAQKAGVKVQQIYVLPAGKARLANAFAMQGNNVLLTDYLLQHLDKREVDAIVAHELTHLKRRDPRKLSLAFAVSAAVPLVLTLGLADAMDIDRWRPVFPVLITLSLLGFYFFSRRLERGADAGAVALTGDPEALITGLARITSLSTMPLQWGKWEERFLTHPSTMRRAQAIAQRAGITPDRLQEILSAPGADPDRYPLPPTVVDQEKLFSTSFKYRVLAGNSWMLMAVMVLTPALAARLALLGHPAGMTQAAIYLGGLAATLALYLTAWNYVGLRGYGALRRRLRQKLERESAQPGSGEALFAGFAPARLPRIYEGLYDWDMGFLSIEDDHLAYLGEQVRFALRRDQVTAVRLGAGGPGWLRAPRIYVTWHDEIQATDRTFNLRAAEARSMRQLGRDARSLAKRLQAWQQQPSIAVATPSTPDDLGTPEIGEVTSLPPHAWFNPRSIIRSLLVVGVLAAGVSVLLGLPFDLEQGGAGWCVVGIACVAGIFQWWPYLVYREPAA
jgi:Zn-dependent protease with chaperone function